MFDQKIAVPVQLLGSVAYTKKLEATSKFKIKSNFVAYLKNLNCSWICFGRYLEFLKKGNNFVHCLAPCVSQLYCSSHHFSPPGGQANMQIIP